MKEQSKPRLSLCLIMRDEEENLSRCLESVAGLVDEVVAVDTGSQDSSVALARRYGARVFLLPWKGDFSSPRNLALELAGGEWVLALDADEELAGDRDCLGELLERRDVEGYFLTILSPTSNRPGADVLRHQSLRLFRRRAEYCFRGAIHEQIVPSIQTARPKALLLRGCGLKVYHYGYREEVLSAKNRRNLEILSAAVAESPSDPFLRFNLGGAYFQAREYKLALETWDRLYREAPRTLSWFPTLVRNLAILKMDRQDYYGALSLLEEGCSCFPLYVDLFYLRALTLKRLGRYSEALKCLDFCQKLGDAPGEYVSSIGVGGYQAFYLQGLILEEAGLRRRAVRAFSSALKENPQHLASFTRLVALEKNSAAVADSRVKPGGVAVSEAGGMKGEGGLQQQEMLSEALAAVGEYREALEVLNYSGLEREDTAKPVKAEAAHVNNWKLMLAGESNLTKGCNRKLEAVGTTGSGQQPEDGSRLQAFRTDSRPLFLAGRCLLGLGRYSEAARCLAMVQPGSGEVYRQALVESWYCAQLSGRTAAGEMCLKKLKLLGDVVHYEVFMLYQQLAAGETKESHPEECKEGDDNGSEDSAESRDCPGIIRSDNLNHARAANGDLNLDQVRQHLRKENGYEEAAWSMIRHFLAAGARDRVKTAVSLISLLGIKDAPLKLGKIYYHYGWKIEAADELLNSLKNRVVDDEMCLMLGEILTERGIYLEAAAFYQQALEYSPERLVSRLGLAKAYLSQSLAILEEGQVLLGPLEEFTSTLDELRSVLKRLAEMANIICVRH